MLIRAVRLGNQTRRQQQWTPGSARLLLARLFSYLQPQLQSEKEDRSQEQRVEWLRSFEAYLQKTSSELPKDWITTNFSRSSGPGGQNVNKCELVSRNGSQRLWTLTHMSLIIVIVIADFLVNTKAEVRLSLAAASKEQFETPVMPKEVIRYLTSHSPYYTASSHSLLVSSMKTRSQTGNLEDALEKIQKHLISLLSQDIRGETSVEQQDKIKSLIARDKARTRSNKEKRGSVKSGRRVNKGSIDF